MSGEALKLSLAPGLRNLDPCDFEKMKGAWDAVWGTAKDLASLAVSANPLSQVIQSTQGLKKSYAELKGLLSAGKADYQKSGSFASAFQAAWNEDARRIDAEKQDPLKGLKQSGEQLGQDLALSRCLTPFGLYSLSCNLTGNVATQAAMLFAGPELLAAKVERSAAKLGGAAARKLAAGAERGGASLAADASVAAKALPGASGVKVEKLIGELQGSTPTAKISDDLEKYIADIRELTLRPVDPARIPKRPGVQVLRNLENGPPVGWISESGQVWSVTADGKHLQVAIRGSRPPVTFMQSMASTAENKIVADRKFAEIYKDWVEGSQNAARKRQNLAPLEPKPLQHYIDTLERTPRVHFVTEEDRAIQIAANRWRRMENPPLPDLPLPRVDSVRANPSRLQRWEEANELLRDQGLPPLPRPTISPDQIDLDGLF